MDINNTINNSEFILPWQELIWQQVLNTKNQNHIAHALLFAGPLGIGKLQFATAFKSSLLCSKNSISEPGCGQCRFCKMSEHPDFHNVTFEVDEKTGKVSKSIKIDQIRKIIEFSLLHSHYSKAKIIIIHPAEAMTVSASNALLKILEEPPEGTYFVLISNETHNLSATIKSRCQLVQFKIPDANVSRQWLLSQSINKELIEPCLKLAFNAPIAAKDYADKKYIEQHIILINNILSITNNSVDPMDIASTWLKIESNLPLQALYSCLSDLILLKSVGSESEIINDSNRAILQNIANSVSFTGLYVILDKLLLAKHQIKSNISLLGIYEDILNLWQRLTNKVKII